MWKLDHKEGWAPKNWWFQVVVLEKTLDSHLDSKEIKPINPKGNQLWIFIGRTNTEVEAPILGRPEAKSQHTGKDPDTGKDWGQEEKGADTGWDSSMPSSTQWTGYWANSRTQWRTGKPGVVQSMESQRVRHNLGTERQQLYANKMNNLEETDKF